MAVVLLLTCLWFTHVASKRTKPLCVPVYPQPCRSPKNIKQAVPNPKDDVGENPLVVSSTVAAAVCEFWFTVLRNPICISNH